MFLWFYKRTHEPLISITEGNEKPKMKTETKKKKNEGEKSQEKKKKNSALLDNASMREKNPVSSRPDYRLRLRVKIA